MSGMKVTRILYLSQLALTGAGVKYEEGRGGECSKSFFSRRKEKLGHIQGAQEVGTTKLVGDGKV